MSTSPLRYGLSSLRRRPLLALLAWSLPEALPAALIGFAVSRSVDDGFLAGRPLIGLAWLGSVLVAALLGAVGARQVLHRLGDLVEPVRDDLVRRVVTGALGHGVTGRPDDGVVTRLTRQVETVRDSYAGLIVVVRAFVVSIIGTLAGLLSLTPVLLVLILPPIAFGLGAFLATLRLTAARLRASVRADEELSVTSGSVLAGGRDITASGGEDRALAWVAGPIARHATAERALAGTAILRTLCFTIAGWGPLLVVLSAGPWLVAGGLTTGEIMGGLTYVLFGIQPALGKLMSVLGGSGLRLAVVLGRILDATEAPAPSPRMTGGDGRLVLRGVTFAYGRHSEPVLRDLDLDVGAGDHLAVIGPSGIGKSTLAAILCGLVRPDSGTVRLGARCVLIPQEAYVFTGTVGENLRYLRPDADTGEIEEAVAAIGATTLVARLGGLTAPISPGDLSPGERQLVALVRAYLSPARIAVLDEATCHLDPSAERQAEEAFSRRGRTLIVIAHRVSSALRAPRVLALDGVQAVIGEHASLARTSALYRELLGHSSAGQPTIV